jgi:hypothetical protein
LVRDDGIAFGDFCQELLFAVAAHLL